MVTAIWFAYGRVDNNLEQWHKIRLLEKTIAQMKCQANDKEFEQCQDVRWWREQLLNLQKYVDDQHAAIKQLRDENKSMARKLANLHAKRNRTEES